VGTGPFTLKQWWQGAFLHLKKNPYFFGTGKTINGRRIGPFFNDLIYTVYGTSDVAILALKKGRHRHVLVAYPARLSGRPEQPGAKTSACLPMKRARFILSGSICVGRPFNNHRLAPGRGLS
jgi:hypothetical protein